MGKSMVDPIAQAYGRSAVDWQETPERPEATADAPYGEPAYAVARIRIPERPTAKVTIAEAVWSDCFRRPPWWLRWLLTLRYMGRSLPTALMLIGPDRRDRAFWLGDGSPEERPFLNTLRGGLSLRAYFTSPEVRQMMRIGWRLLTLAVLFSALVGLATTHPWAAAVIAAVVIGVLCTRLNVADHVITAAARDTEREALLGYLEHRLRWLERRCDDIVIIAHSQGGYLAHQLLARDNGRNQAKVIRFVGVGSGLKPISILRQTQRPAVLLVSWLLPAASLCFSWGLLPLFSDASVMAGVMKAMAGTTMLLAMPLITLTPERTSAQLNHALDAIRPQALSDYLPIDITGMDGTRWGLVAVGALITAGCAPLVRRFIRPVIQDSLNLPKGTSARELEWREHSSQHDMVGRMLLPPLPDQVEQEATPVLGHPLRDHTLYFSPDGMLVRQLAGDVLSDLETKTKSFGAAEWQGKVARYTQALRKQHDRRRMFHGLITLAVAFAVLVPQLALGASLPGAVVRMWLPLGLVALFLSYIFTRRGRKSLRKMVAALDTELSGGPPHEPLLAIVPPTRRPVIVISLLLGSLFAAYGAV
ncbi:MULTISPECIES: hypothetical protein [unclassified Streptomyces]|uniref:hypothetical protein n=1 Tax=unclassified Streptomyces TaxID=2593676 RepID=UPI000377CE94|nr:MULTISPECIES: hypothetical protein [unclassified Streptomyces]MYT27517.1 hypothetical protein [Streptomyces sp. SID8354]